MKNMTLKSIRTLVFSTIFFLPLLASAEFKTTSQKLFTMPSNHYQSIKQNIDYIDPIYFKDYTFAYRILENEKYFAVINAKEGKLYDFVYNLNVNGAVSPNKKNLFYVAQEGKEPFEEFVVKNETEGPRFTGYIYIIRNVENGDSFFTKDGENLIYSFKENGKSYLASTDGTKTEFPYPFTVAGALYSPDGDNIAYIVSSETEEGERVVFDGKLGKKYDGILSLKFFDNKIVKYAGVILPNACKEHIYTPCEKVNIEIVENDKVVKKITGGIPVFQFTSDGSKYAYRQQKQKKYRGAEVTGESIVFNKKYGPFLWLDEDRSYLNTKFVFSPNSKKVAYIARSPDGKYVLVKINGRLIKKYSWSTQGVEPQIANLTFSPDSKSFAFSVKKYSDITKPPAYFIVLNGKEIRAPGLSPKSLRFSSDSKKLVYTTTTEDGLSSVTVGDKKGEAYYGIYDLQFSPDGKYVGYAALKKESSEDDEVEVWWIAEALE